MNTVTMDVEVLSYNAADWKMSEHGFEADDIDRLIDDRDYQTATSLTAGFRLHATYRPECRDPKNPTADVYIIQLVRHDGEHTRMVEQFFYTPE